MREAGLLLDWRGRELYWHLPEGRSGGRLPDSQALWDVMWENRDVLGGFAHTHPGSGTPGPSYEDVTTFAALELGLGLTLDWWILSSDSMILVRWGGRDRLDYSQLSVTQVPQWADQLRRHSDIEPWRPERVRRSREGPRTGSG